MLSRIGCNPRSGSPCCFEIDDEISLVVDQLSIASHRSSPYCCQSTDFSAQQMRSGLIGTLLAERRDAVLFHFRNRGFRLFYVEVRLLDDLDGSRLLRVFNCAIDRC
jgi:hypothetical protein